MKEIHTLFEWIFSGDSQSIELFIGHRQSTNRNNISIVQSDALVYNSIRYFSKEGVVYDTHKYHQIILFSANEKSIFKNFNQYKERLEHILGDIILIKEKFVFQNTKPERKLTTDLLKNIEEGSKRNRRLNQVVISYGTLVVCKIHTFILADFLNKIGKTQISRLDFNKMNDIISMENNIKYRKKIAFFQLRKKYFKRSEIIGQFNKQFILLKIRNCILIIDQHALHERIMLEKLIRNKKNRINLNRAKEMACKNAIKFNEKLTKLKMMEIVSFIPYLNEPFICCHGRPSVLHLFTQN